MKDVFLCHASEDKEEVVRPIYNALTDAGIKCWLDEAEILAGDSITKKVNEGLAESRYVMVILSSSFLEKNWPDRELNASLSEEASSGLVRVVPILVGDNSEIEAILLKYFLIKDKYYLMWNGNIDEIVQAIQKRLGHSVAESRQPSIPQTPTSSLEIPMPRIKKKFTDRDRNKFFKASFETVKTYFQQALNQLDNSSDDVEVEFEEIHSYKFISTIYVHGEVTAKCKIWEYDNFGSNTIGYYEGRHDISSDSASNDMLTVEDDEHSLCLKTMMAPMTGAKENMTADDASEYLWKRFIDQIQ